MVGAASSVIVRFCGAACCLKAAGVSLLAGFVLSGRDHRKAMSLTYNPACRLQVPRRRAYSR